MNQSVYKNNPTKFFPEVWHVPKDDWKMFEFLRAVFSAINKKIKLIRTSTETV